jgi:hypothetical protein
MASTISLEKVNVNITGLLYGWLKQRLTQENFNWLDTRKAQIENGANVRVFFTTFSAVPRYTGKNDLNLTSQELETASATRTNWFPSHWSIDQAARTLLLLSLPQSDSDKYLHALEQLFAAADVGELVALYQALPLLPYPEKLRARAAEGVRSNMTAVFNAVALRNPYPSEYLDNIAWNQMVLKALFVGSPLHLIQDLDRRANPELARMLVDYANERKAANRTVSPEIWPLVSVTSDQ